MDDVGLTQEFFDPKTKGRLSLKEWRHLLAHGHSVMRAPLRFAEKMRLGYFLVRVGTWRRALLARELIEAMRHMVHRLHLRCRRVFAASSK
jgi:hypothetical protein